MTRKRIKQYRQPEALRDILERVLSGKKFRLHCGHHVSFGEMLSNDVMIRNGKKFKIICTQCGY